MRYAVIKNGVVINTPEAEDAAFADSQGWVAMPDDAGIGWLFDGATFRQNVHQVTIAEHNAPILAALVENDRKTIRALREAMTGGNHDRLMECEARAVALRAQMRKE